jgi:surface antigen
MKGLTGKFAAMAVVVATSGMASSVHAAPTALSPALETARDDDFSALPYLQCVPYARDVSGIRLYGDAWTWWDQANGRYGRGNRPKPGAVMSFRPYGPMKLGHVAAVSRVLDSRTVLLRHANWSIIDGRRGQVEDNVRAIDVSPDNDWSEVRVWYAPLGNLGTTHWPVNGFIYNERPSDAGRGMVLANARGPSPRLAVLSSAFAPQPAAKSRIGADFLKGLATDSPAPSPARPVVRSNLAYAQMARADERVAPARLSPQLRNDPIGRIIASRMR